MVDVVTAEDGTELEYGRRRGARPVKVVPTKIALWALLGGLSAGGVSVGGVTMWAAKAFIAQEISIHNRDAEAHVGLVRVLDRVQQSNAQDDAEKARLQAQLDQITRDLREVRDAVNRLDGRIKAPR